MSPQRTVRELYKDAILRYEQVSGDLDAVEATREEANRQITSLRTKMQDDAFDSIAARTDDLQLLVLGLQAVAEKARHNGIDISGIAALTTEAHGMIDTFKSMRETL